MSHTVHPYSHRLGIIRDWRSRWFGAKDKYKENLRADVLIIEFLKKRFKGVFVSLMEIERSEKIFRLMIETSRPGMIIGRQHEGLDKLRHEILQFMRRHKISLKQELKIAEGLEKRLLFRRVMKQMAEKAFANRDVQGIKIVLSGIMGGSNMARVESKRLGRVPLQTFRADIDYAFYEAQLPLGKIGIKIWIYKGEIFAKK